MTSSLALRPDLNECLLEDRTLLAYAPGLQASQFIPTSAGTNQFLVSGFSLGGGGGAVYPGPQFFYMTIGVYTSSNGGAGGGVRLGGTASIYNPPSALPSLQGPAVGSGVNGGGGAGYGGAVSSGYNTSLNASNNYGMGATAVGSVAPHISGTTDQLVEAQNAGQSTGSGVAPGASAAQNAAPATANPPSQGQPLIGPTDHLLGRNLGGTANLLKGPSTGIGAPAR